MQLLQLCWVVLLCSVRVFCCLFSENLFMILNVSSCQAAITYFNAFQLIWIISLASQWMHLYFLSLFLFLCYRTHLYGNCYWKIIAMQPDLSNWNKTNITSHCFSIGVFMSTANIFSLNVCYASFSGFKYTYSHISLTVYMLPYCSLSFSCVSLSFTNNFSKLKTIRKRRIVSLSLLFDIYTHTHNLYSIYLPYFITLFPLECAERERYRITWHNKGGSL